ncbi:chymotrypsin-like protease CTRL-1 [Amphiura filiformis]|uniref:chymotrypsin-like protease CTRL-1 n=1 Tax=Amphiura filiformis TaxID=82378 RepID=UPI003B21CE4D
MMTSTNTTMMNVDLESGFSFPSTISKPPPTQDTKVPLSTTPDDIEKPITCCSHSGKRLIAISALVLSALLVGMIVATVVTFSLGMHRRHITTGVHHYHHHQNHVTNTTEEDVNNDAPPPVQSGSGLTWVELQSTSGRGNISPSDTRIVNGDTVANEAVWPWAAYLSTLNGEYFCGATLISPQWAVTAAHCVEGIAATTPLNLTFGQLDQNAPPSNTRVEVTTTNIISHPDYNSVTTNNDIALLKLGTSVDITPVCVNSNVLEQPTFRSTATNPNPCYVVGWGETSSGGPSSGTLQQVASQLVSNAICKAAYGASYITDQMICTDTSNNSGSCQGDSGGPLMCRKSTSIVTGNGDAWELVGITSYKLLGCANPAYPDVLARVSQFHSWIQSKIENDL